MKILLTGGMGMLGKAIIELAPKCAPHIKLFNPNRKELNLLDQSEVQNFIKSHSDLNGIIHCAAKVGGIQANIADQAGFLSDNLQMSLNIINAAREAKIPRFINFGSSCMYPRNFGKALKEKDLLAGPLEPTNEGYAIAKIATAKLCVSIAAQDDLAYRTFIPCNLYGPGDFYDPERSHLLAAIIAKTNAAISGKQESIEIWGDGKARREFTYVDDLAVFALRSLARLEKLPPILNTGSDKDHSVLQCYKMISDIMGYKGDFVHNLDAPIGMDHKLMDSSLAKEYGWRPETNLQDGLQKTIKAYQALQK